MALKIWLNGSMKKINTTLQKPVTFINGQKYKLDKAYTFVNGEKKLIWGETGVQIDYISSTGTLGGGKVFAIGEDWLNVSNNNSVYRIDISNISNPILIQDVVWGTVARSNNFQSTSNSMLFEAEVQGSNNSSTDYKLFVNPATGVITATSFANPNTSTSGYKRFLGSTANDYISYFYKFRGVNYSNPFENKIYWNNSNIISINTEYLFRGLTQATANSILIVLTGTSQSKVYEITSSGRTDTGWTESDQIACVVYDNGFLYSQNIEASQNIITKRNVNSLSTVIQTYNAGENRRAKFVGMIGELIYVISAPFSRVNMTPDSVVKLIVLSKDDFSIVLEKVLPNDPFNENNGYPYFWYDCEGIAQVSQTGFLGVGTFDNSTLALRVARFSDLI